jgi:hypothetical protein
MHATSTQSIKNLSLSFARDGAAVDNPLLVRAGPSPIVYHAMRRYHTYLRPDTNYVYGPNAVEWLLHMHIQV